MELSLSQSRIAVLIVQGYGVDAGRFDGRAHLLADGIVIDKRTLCRAEGFAVLHKSATWGSSVYIYRTTTPSAVMLFAKMRQLGSRCDISS